MPPTVTERVATVERRTDRLEDILAGFMARTDVYIKRIDERMAQTDADMAQTDEHMAQMKVRIAQTDEHMAQMKVRIAQTDEHMAQMKVRIAQTDEHMAQMKNRIAQTDERMKQTDERVDRFFERMERDRAEMKKQWGDLANKMGTVVEDIVAPSIRRLAGTVFDCGTEQRFYTRVSAKRDGDPARVREFDALYVGGRAVLLNESKSTVRSEDARAFVEFVRDGEFARYFPEHAQLPIVPAFSSLSLPDDMVTYLTRQGIYAVAMGGEAMQVLNLDEARERRARREQA